MNFLRNSQNGTHQKWRTSRRSGSPPRCKSGILKPRIPDFPKMFIPLLPLYLPFQIWQAQTTTPPNDQYWPVGGMDTSHSDLKPPLTNFELILWPVLVIMRVYTFSMAGTGQQEIVHFLTGQYQSMRECTVLRASIGLR